jgi:HPt (histidine-containing phosphotransfer) domain-containing protein
LGQHEQQQACGPDVTSPNEEFERVRQSFRIRLRGEQARLATLAEDLRVEKSGSTSVLADIGMFAHRLRGAAAVFDAPELSNAAKALEIAVLIASAGSGRNGDPGVWSTLRTLTDQLASINSQAWRGIAPTRTDPAL